MKNINNKIPITIDTEKIGKSPGGKEYMKGFVEIILSKLTSDEKKPLAVGGIAATLSGPFAHKGLMVVEIQENGNVPCISRKRRSYNRY